MRGIYFLYFFIFLSFCAWSQEDRSLNGLNSEYRFAHKGVADGLSPGPINDFLKEKDGFLWIATNSGLNRYDGYEFQLFSPKSSNLAAIQSRNFRRLFSDPLGNIWCVTPEGINIFDPITQSFTADQSTILKELQISKKRIVDIVELQQKKFLLIHEDGEVTMFDSETKKKEELTNYNQQIKRRDLSLSSVILSGKSEIWVIYKTGLIQRLDVKQFSILSEYDRLSNIFKGEEHDFEMLQDKNGNLWIHLFQDYGVYKYEVKKNVIEHFDRNTEKLALSNNLISTIEKDSEGNIWIGSDLGGINVVNPDDLSVRYIKTNSEISNTLSHNSVTSLYLDQQGILWIGTFKNGIDYYHPNIVRFPLRKKVISDPESLPFNDVNVFTEDDAGNLFIGTNGGGLIKWNKKTGEYRQYLQDTEDIKSISSDVIVSLLYESKNRLWVGTYLGGLNLMTENGFIHFKHDPEDKNTIAGNNIWELFEDSKGNIWIGTLTGGVDIFDEDSRQFIHSSETGGKYPIHINYISSIAEDADENIWLGSSNGIDKIDLKTNTVRHYNHQPDDTTSLSDNNILTIYRDSNNNMWIGSHEGLNLYDKENDLFYRYGIKDGLPGEKIIGLVEDNEKDLWITSSFGIAQFKKDEQRDSATRIAPNFKIYNDLDGLQGNLFNENSIFKNSDGEILVGGLHGYNVFRPHEFKYNQKKPKIIFTGFSLFNEEISTGEKVGGKAILKKPLFETDKIRLKYDQNFFSIEFAALDFFQPSKNSYRYKLIGVDNEWQNLSNSQRIASYTNLDPGEYEFKVQASNNDQVWNREGASLKIEILPPFYKTIYAYTAYVFIILAFLHLARRRIIKKQQRTFEVQQEKREAEHLHKMDLMKIRFFTNISHEFKTPLSMILSPISRLKEQKLGPHLNEQVETINENAQRLLNLINQILDLGNVKNDTLLTSSKANIIEFISDIVKGFKDYAESKGVNLYFESEESSYYTIFDMDKLDKMVYNLLSNAVKFTPQGGEIFVDLELGDPVLSKPSSKVEKKWFIIKVKDTGIGISAEDQEHIFDRFYKVELKDDSNKTGSGIGLALVKEYVKLYAGEILVNSELEKGTTFILKLPLQKIPATEISESHNKSAAKIAGKDDSLPTVLIIDDSREFLNFLSNNLRDYYNLFIAVDGETGWKKALSIVPDLIICDWEMPGINGTDLCLKIRNDARTRHIPFIVLSGNHSEENKLAGLKAGANDYVTKPFKLEVLKSRIDNLIEQRKSFQEAYRKKIEVPDVINRVRIETEDEKLMRKVLQVIKKNYKDSDFGVEKLALDLGVSRSFLYNKTVSLFEKSPSDLITDIRLEKGKNLLEESQLTISEIAFQTGFNNPKYFTKNFRKKYQILPSAFKKKNS